MSPPTPGERNSPYSTRTAKSAPFLPSDEYVFMYRRDSPPTGTLRHRALPDRVRATNDEYAWAGCTQAQRKALVELRGGHVGIMGERDAPKRSA